MARSLTVWMLLILWSGTALAEQYTSQSSCIRAGESYEPCAKLFPDPVAKKPKPLPIAACTAMLDEATSHERQALVALRFDQFEAVSSHSKQSASLVQSAFACAEGTDMKPETLAPFERAKEDWRTQHAVLEAAMNAKLKTQ